MKRLVFSGIIFFVAGFCLAQVKVVTTTTVIYDLVKQIGKDRVKADYICRGDQDPHFVEVMPSYMLKLRNADLVFKIGLDLEKWLPQLIDGSRNDHLKLIDLSENINKKDVPAQKMDASYGDIHPYGNPHYWLDPENAKIMANEIYEALSGQSPEDESYFKKNLDNYNALLDKKINEWKAKVSSLKSRQVIFYHAEWIYFADRFGIQIAGYVEPKPGISPSPSHNAEIIQLIKKSKIKIIIMANFYSDTAPNQIASLTGVQVAKVPVSVYGTGNVNSYIDMIDYIISAITHNG
jgi:zinc/manganese transport system substrate-binding protein